MATFHRAVHFHWSLPLRGPCSAPEGLLHFTSSVLFTFLEVIYLHLPDGLTLALTPVDRYALVLTTAVSLYNFVIHVVPNFGLAADAVFSP
jgi:hypothetical protein